MAESGQVEEKNVDPLAEFRTVPDKLDDMIRIARQIATPGKGILAADESTGTIGNRFEQINVENKEENRRKYRELLFTSERIENFISGVILYEETLRQSTKDGTSFVKVLNDTGKNGNQNGVVVGIKVDQGALDLPFKPGASFTQGLTGLDNKGKEIGRAETYYKEGARFAKWRAKLKIIDGYVSQESIDETAWTLARYAAICQKHGLVPIVEPELLMDGDHSLEECQYWTEKIVTACYKALSDQEVVLEATLLKPNMCLPGKDYKGPKPTPQQNALATATMLRRSVPAAVPGIVFLSGGQSEEDATIHLNEINRLGQYPNQKFPWNVSFSYGRALQSSCLKAWNGSDSNIKAGQDAFIARAQANSAACLGEYMGGNGSGASGVSNFTEDYGY